VIFVDDRIGSKDLHPLLIKAGLDAVLSQLDSGDVAFSGNGPDGVIYVGVERKRLMDILDCMVHGRLADIQAPKMQGTFQSQWLVVEGAYRPSNDGLLEVCVYGGPRAPYKWQPAELGSRRFMYSDLESYLVAISDRTNMIVRRSQNRYETVHIIKALYKYYQKPWHEHRSMEAMYKAPRPAILTERASFARRALVELPGVDWVLSGRMDKFFESSMCNVCLATEEDVRVIEGIGKAKSHAIYKALRGR